LSPNVETTVVLRSHHKRYLKIDGKGGVRADEKDPRQPSAQWRIAFHGGKVALRASDHSYLSALHGKVTAVNKQTPGENELFKAVFSSHKKGQTVVLMASNGKYVCAERLGRVVANRTLAQSFETWRITPLSNFNTN
jgi:ribulose-5-phosphate 4-epimerase/fuculose-1-phosphate aldolase